LFKLLIGVVVAMALGSVAYAAASEFQSDGSQVLQVSADQATSCQTSQVHVAHFDAELDGQTFTQFQISNIDTECQNVGVKVPVRIYDDAAPTVAICSNSATQNTVITGSIYTVTLNGPCDIHTADIIRILFQSS
jgi:uncharacterized protein (UPF0333 family)